MSITMDQMAPALFAGCNVPFDRAFLSAAARRCSLPEPVGRHILDIIRHDESTGEAERLLAQMDTVYALLMTFDLSDAVTGGLRRRTDQLRGVLERTRGDLTITLRQQRLQDALSRMERTMQEAEDGAAG